MGLGLFIIPYASSITYICVLVIATFAVTLIFKTSATTNFAQSTIAALGSYFASYFLILKQWNIWAALAVSVVFGICCGLFIDLVIFRNGKNVNLVGKQIITMGLVTVIANIIPMFFRFAITTPPIIPSFFNKMFIVNLPDGSMFFVTAHALICLAITVAVITVLFLLLRFSKWGLGVRTTASNEYVAQMMGINTYAITAISWGIAGGLGVLAAIMYLGSGTRLENPYIMTGFQVDAFLAGILGGFGTFYGPLISAVLLQIVDSTIGLLAMIPGLELITRWKQAIVLIIVMICIYIKPNGLFGKKIVKKV